MIERTYDHLNRLEHYRASPAVSEACGRTNRYNLAGQLDPSVALDGSYWDYDYNERGEVTDGVKRWPDHTLIGGHDFGYTFDASGNRLTHQRDAESYTYVPNSLNQYHSRSTPATYLHLLGLAPAGQNVTLSENGVNVLTTRRDEFFYGAMNRGTLSSPLQTEVVIQTSGGASQSGQVRLPPSGESFTYDNRGNLLNDGLWDYGWDAQNRLIWAESRGWASPVRRLVMTYDGLGRRIQLLFKVNSEVKTNLVYVYDGWQLLAELNGLNNNALLRSYGWGLDLSGSPSGAGGVGGLLWVYSHADGKAHDVVCDGQGNVVGLVDGSTGQVSARYEYGPFGEVIRQTGPMAKANPFRFSTKYTDEETELVYYGYRYYSPTLGRWLSRDPLEEEGGLNLYGFVGNDPVNYFDPFGEYVKSIKASRTAFNQITVEILFRVHWSSNECDDMKGRRSLEEQKQFDKKAAEIWSGQFSHKSGFGRFIGLGKTVVRYDVKTTFESTYADAGDPYPTESATIVSQNPEWGSSENRANAVLGGPAPPGIPYQYSIELFRGNSVRVYAHEIGHTLGCQDRYSDVTDPVTKKVTSVPHSGWEGNIMADHRFDPDYRNIEEILKVWKATIQ